MCWCTSNGDRTCQRWETESSYHGIYEEQCTKDKYREKLECNKNGYWCDDSKLSGNKGRFRKFNNMNY